MSFIIIVISLYIIIQYYASIVLKQNIRTNFFTNGISTSFIDFSMQSFNKYFQNYVNNTIITIINPLNCRLDYQKNEIGQIIQNSNEFSKNMQENIKKDNENKLIQYNNLYTDTQTNIETLKSAIQQLTDRYLENSEYVKNLYSKYSNKLSSFVNKLFKVLNVLQYQFNLAYITPSLNTAIQPIKNLYNSIYTVLIKNPDYVKQYVTDYKLSDIKPLSQKLGSVQNLSSNFKNSNKLFQKLNF